MKKEDLIHGLVYGVAVGIPFYALGGVVEPFVAGITAPIFAAAGFTIGFGLSVLPKNA